MAAWITARHRHYFVLRDWCWRVWSLHDGSWWWLECPCGRLAPFPPGTRSGSGKVDPGKVLHGP